MALISTTRPPPSETTGTERFTSGVTTPVHMNFIGYLAHLDRGQRKLAGVLHGEDVGVGIGFHDFGRRRL